MDPRVERSDLELSYIIAPKRVVPDEVTLFIFLYILRGGNEGGVGIEQVAFTFSISQGT